MATTPPPEEPTTRQPGPSYTLNVSDMARLPIPGNAEFLALVVALIVAWLVAWTTDSLTANDWFFFFAVTTAAYLLSRGIAKASRVLEQ
jgi:hypothetical protein